MENNVEEKLLQLGWTIEQDEVANFANKIEESVMIEDIVDVTMMEDELEVDQVGLGSCGLQTWIGILTWGSVMIMMMM